MTRREHVSLKDTLGATAAAFLLARRATSAVDPVLRGAGLVRQRRSDGREIPTGAGVVPVVAGLWADLAFGAGRHAGPAYHLPVMAAAISGLIDDASRGTGPRGWREHWRKLRDGRPSTGILKAALISLAAAGPAVGEMRQRGTTRSLLTLASTVLAANALNQLDTAPGRAVTAFLAGFGLVGLIAPGDRRCFWLGGLPMASAALGYLPFDRGGRVMLGDAGANALGAALGWVAGESLSDRGLLLWTAALLGLNAALDRWSLSRFLDRRSRRREAGLRLRPGKGRERMEAKMPLPG